MKQITMPEMRFFDWVPDEVSLTLRAAGGSYGGGSEVLVVEIVEDEDDKPHL